MGEETIALNRKARHEFHDRRHARGGHRADRARRSSRSAQARSASRTRTPGSSAARRGSIGAHIAPYAGGNRWNHEAKRTRKLLLHRDEIDELLGRTKSKGLTLVPLRLYIDGRSHAKLRARVAAAASSSTTGAATSPIATRAATSTRELADARRGR